MALMEPLITMRVIMSVLLLNCLKIYFNFIYFFYNILIKDFHMLNMRIGMVIYGHIKYVQIMVN